MHGTYLIEVSYKKGVADPVAGGLQSAIRELSSISVKQVSASQLYRLIGDLTPVARTRIAQDLLCDPVVQEYRDGIWSSLTTAERLPPREQPIVIDVWYKSGVTDVVGESVLKGIRDLSLDGVTDVRTGSRYRFWGLKSIDAARTIAGNFLGNPLIQDHSIHAD
jgi:phosphoribosylformylglycinamidine (FGAM) synthase PurS component